LTWAFHKSEEVALLDQHIELRCAISTEIRIIKVHPKPGTSLPIEDVNGPAIGLVIMSQKHHYGCWELEPANYLGALSKRQKIGNGFVHCFQFAQLKHPNDLHLSKHLNSPPFVEVNLQILQPVGCQN